MVVFIKFGRKLGIGSSVLIVIVSPHSFSISLGPVLEKKTTAAPKAAIDEVDPAPRMSMLQ